MVIKCNTDSLYIGMLSSGFGHVINISSIAGKFGTNRRTSYSAAKFGMLGMMDSLRCEVYSSPLSMCILLLAT